jgi:hypothetical protein
LDGLDALKLGVLDGSVNQSMVLRLKVAPEGLTDASGDAGLDVVLGEIDLRVAVELAKAGVRYAKSATPAKAAAAISH